MVDGDVCQRIELQEVSDDVKDALSGLISFTAWSSATLPLSDAMLDAAANYRVVWMASPNEDSLDFHFPICIRNHSELSEDVKQQLRGCFVGQVKNLSDDIYLGEAVKLCLTQANTASLKTTCKVVVSMLFMIGLGKVRKRSLPDNCSFFFVTIPDFPKYLFVVVNGFPGVNQTEQQLLQLLTAGEDLSEMVQKQNLELRRELLSEISAAGNFVQIPS